MPATTKPRRYRGDNYWEKEPPIKVATDKVRVCYYPIAGKLQISAGWKNAKTGKVRFGRTAVLDTSVIGSSPEAFILLQTFVDQVRSYSASLS